MSDQMVIAMTIKLIAGFSAAVLSILLWSKTRDGAWLSMVLGVVFLYIQQLLEILEAFGFIGYKSLALGGVVIIPLIFDTLPFIFFAVGMLVILRRR